MRWICLVAIAYALATQSALTSAESLDSTVRGLTVQDVTAWSDGLLPSALHSGDIAGAVVIVVKDGAVLFQKGYGYADVATGQPVDAQRTLFRPGSISKLLTWTAVMQQVEQGRLDLDTDINQYLDFRIPPRNGKHITLRHMMTHTAGFEEQIKGLWAGERDRDLSLETYVKRWTPKRIYDPGTTPAYSNYATALAGYILARVARQSFDEYLEDHVLGPLGMENSSFRQPLPVRFQPHMSKGYAQASLPDRPYELIPPAPAGALAATGADMANFMLAQLQQGRFGDKQLLKPETVRLMHDTALTVLPPLNRMLLGFYESNCNGHRSVGHGGDSQWFHSTMHLFTEDGIGLYVSLNSTGQGGASSALLEGIFEGFCDRYLPGPHPDGEIDQALARRHAQLMGAQRFENSRRAESSFVSLFSFFSQVSVSPRPDGTIGFGLSPAGTLATWREIAPLVWREVGGKGLLAAEMKEGRVVRFSVDSVSPYMVFTPVPWWRSSKWLMPSLLISGITLMLTTIMWPAAALIRRHHGVLLSLPGQRLTAYRLSRFAALAVLLMLITWVATFITCAGDAALLSPRLDGWFRFLQWSSMVIFIGAAAVMLWNVLVVWQAGARWMTRAWSVLMALSCSAVLWLAASHDLLALDVNY